MVHCVFLCYFRFFLVFSWLWLGFSEYRNFNRLVWFWNRFSNEMFKFEAWVVFVASVQCDDFLCAGASGRVRCDGRSGVDLILLWKWRSTLPFQRRHGRNSPFWILSLNVHANVYRCRKLGQRRRQLPRHWKWTLPGSTVLFFCVLVRVWGWSLSGHLIRKNMSKVAVN